MDSKPHVLLNNLPSTKDHPLDMPSSRSLRTRSSSSFLQRSGSAATAYPQPSANGNRDLQQQRHNSSNSSFERAYTNFGSSEFGAEIQTAPDHSPYRYSQQSTLVARDSNDFVADPKGYTNALRRPGPPPLSHTSPDPRMLTPSLRQSASFSAGDRSADVTPPRVDSGSTTNSKRYSDEANGGKTRWRKKSGISGFMNSVLGSPRNVKISAPENPVHMIHVGYDNETGQFTVGLSSSVVIAKVPLQLSAKP